MSEKEIAVLRNELDHMNKTIQDLHELLKLHIEKEEQQREKSDRQIEKLIEWLDNKYSSKWVEKVVWSAVWIILVSVFGSLIYLVVPKI